MWSIQLCLNFNIFRGPKSSSNYERYTHLHIKDNVSNFLLHPWENLDKYSF